MSATESKKSITSYVVSSCPNNLIARLLRDATVSDVLSTRADDSSHPVVSVCETDNLTQALAELAKSKVSGAAVLDKDRDMIVGFIDLLDISKYISASIAKPEEAGNLDLSSVSVSGVMNMSDRDPIVPVSEKTDALFATEQLTRLHRLAIFDGKTLSFRAVLSQSDIVRYLYGMLRAGSDLAGSSEAQALLKTPAHKLGLGGSKIMFTGGQVPRVAQIHGANTCSVLQAVQKLALTGCSALAVTDQDTGELIGNFSASDLRACYSDISRHPSKLLLDSVANYLKKYHPESLQPICDSRADLTLGQLLEVMVTKKLHHLWLVHPKTKQPTGLVSLTDILRMVVHCRPESYGWKASGEEEAAITAAASKSAPVAP